MNVIIKFANKSTLTEYDEYILDIIGTKFKENKVEKIWKGEKNCYGDYECIYDGTTEN